MRIRRAVVCDDEPAVLDLLNTFLSRRGYEVPFLCSRGCPVIKNNEMHCHHEKTRKKKAVSSTSGTRLQLPGLWMRRK